MARNEEKAMNLFNKWQTYKTEFHSKSSNRRPLVASECDSAGDAEKFRREIIRDLTKKTALIANASLGEFKIRDLNDEVNKLLKQKHFWEVRIRELGGGDIIKSNRTQLWEVDGKELPGQPGYKYFGAAKQLPGVRELFAEEKNEIELRKKRKTRGDLYKYITPDYYGYRDEDDGVLVLKEVEVEQAKVKESLQAFAKRRKEELDVNNGTAASGASSSQAMSAQVWRDEKLSTEKRHVTEEREFQKYLENFLKTNSTHSANPSAASAGEPEVDNEEALASKKQALLDMLF